MVADGRVDGDWTIPNTPLFKGSFVSRMLCCLYFKARDLCLYDSKNMKLAPVLFKD